MRHIYDCAAGCPIESTLQVISGKWKSVIIYHILQYQKCRFSQLQKLMPDCSKRMLALQLKELEQDEIVTKTIYPTVPPKTEYQLSDFGLTLKSIIVEMEKWGQTFNKKYSKQSVTFKVNDSSNYMIK